MLTAEQKYQKIFEEERKNEYPEVDDFEESMGFSVQRDRLESAARILACPLKVNPPNWQHGRVIYAAAMERLHRDREGVFLDIGTAKGFSACAMAWAIADCEADDMIVSIDVIDPASCEKRNSVAEIDGFKTLKEFVAPFKPNDVSTLFLGCGSRGWLEPALKSHSRIAFAFVDGKHTFEAVTYEIKMISAMQKTGDVIVFDDLQIEPVRRAVTQLPLIDEYERRVIRTGPRTYMYAVKR